MNYDVKNYNKLHFHFLATIKITKAYNSKA